MVRNNMIINKKWGFLFLIYFNLSFSEVIITSPNPPSLNALPTCTPNPAVISQGRGPYVEQIKKPDGSIEQIYSTGEKTPPITTNCLPYRPVSPFLYISPSVPLSH